MSIMPAAIVRSASPRPYALASFPGSCSTSFDRMQTVTGRWVCTDHMTIEHNSTTAGSKRLDPGSLAGVLT
jgi:hypothetical protein